MMALRMISHSPTVADGKLNGRFLGDGDHCMAVSLALKAECRAGDADFSRHFR